MLTKTLGCRQPSLAAAPEPAAAEPVAAEPAGSAAILAEAAAVQAATATCGLVAGGPGGALTAAAGELGGVGSECPAAVCTAAPATAPSTAVQFVLSSTAVTGVLDDPSLLR